MKRTPYTYRKDALVELEPFDPNRVDYSERELSMHTDALLRQAGNDPEAPFLFQEHIEPRWRKEVAPTEGYADAIITNSLSPDGQTLYNRTHPEGRKVNSDAQRKGNGASYYR